MANIMANTLANTIANASAREVFPNFSDGDVLIVLSPSRHYQLHARTLTHHSDFFRRVLNEESAAPLSSKARREGAVIRFRLELVVPDGEDAGVGRFLLRPLDERGRTQAALPAADLEAGKSTIPIYHHYDNLFRLYYYVPAHLNDTHISEVLRDVVGLADVAEHLGSISIVSLVIDNALVKQGQILYRSIATNAAAWADLAFRVRSELIFRESLIHMVGQWPKLSTSPDTMKTMRPEILEVCKMKHHELDDIKRAIELRIMGHYPQHMQRPTNNNIGPGSHTIRGTGKSTRANAYASDAFAWMALNLFRHWLGQHVCGDMNRHALDGGFNFYHALGKGGDAYIDHNAVESFSKYFPLSAKARNAFVTQLNILKEGVRAYVDNLVENRSMLDISKWPVRYLTCLAVKKTDMPWQTTPDAAAGAPVAGPAPSAATPQVPARLPITSLTTHTSNAQPSRKRRHSPDHRSTITTNRRPSPDHRPATQNRRSSHTLDRSTATTEPSPPRSPRRLRTHNHAHQTHSSLRLPPRPASSPYAADISYAADASEEDEEEEEYEREVSESSFDDSMQDEDFVAPTARMMGEGDDDGEEDGEEGMWVGGRG